MKKTKGILSGALAAVMICSSCIGVAASGYTSKTEKSLTFTGGSVLIPKSSFEGENSFSLTADTTLEDVEALKNDSTTFKGVKEVKDTERSMNFTEEIWQHVLTAEGFTFDSQTGKITAAPANYANYRVQSWDFQQNDQAQEQAYIYNNLNVYVQTGKEPSMTSKPRRYTDKLTVGKNGEASGDVLALETFNSPATIYLNGASGNKNPIKMEDESLNTNYPKALSRYSIAGTGFIYRLQNDSQNFKPSKVEVKFVASEAMANAISVQASRGNAYERTATTTDTVCSNNLDSTVSKSGTLTIDLNKNNDFTPEQIRWNESSNVVRWGDYNSYTATLTGFEASDIYFGFKGSANMQVYAIDVYTTEVVDGNPFSYTVTKTEEKDNARSLNFGEALWQNLLTLGNVNYDVKTGKITNLPENVSHINGWDMGDKSEGCAKAFYNNMHMYVQSGSDSDKNARIDWGVTVKSKTESGVFDKFQSNPKVDLNNASRSVLQMEDESRNPNYPKTLSRYVVNWSKLIYDLQNKDHSFKTSKVVIKIMAPEYRTKGDYLSADTSRLTAAYESGVLGSTVDKNGTTLNRLDVKENTDFTTQQCVWKNDKNEDKYSGWKTYDVTITGFESGDEYLALYAKESVYIYAIDVYSEKVNYNVSVSEAEEYDGVEANISFPSGVSQKLPDKLVITKPADISVAIHDGRWTITSDLTDTEFGTVIIGAFDDNGLIKVMNMARASLKGESGSISNVPADCKYLKAMLWNSLSDMQPVSDFNEYSTASGQ